MSVPLASRDSWTLSADRNPHNKTATSTSGKETETKVFTLTGGNHLVAHWLIGGKEVEATFIIDLQSDYVGVSTKADALLAKFGTKRFHHAVRSFVLWVPSLGGKLNDIFYSLIGC